MLFTPRPCEFARNAQLVRFGARKGPLQVFYQGETPAPPGRGKRKGAEERCDPALRATNPLDGGSVRSGAQAEQLATTMPPTGYRLWEMAREVGRTPSKRKRRGRKRDPDDLEAVARPTASAIEGIGARNPIVVAGRDWAGDEYAYVFMLATSATPTGNYHVLIQARTFDFETFDIRSRPAEGGETVWVPFAAPETGGKRRRPGRSSDDNPRPTAVTDEAGKPIIGNCPGQGFETQGLVGSISVVDQVYHYFYTDIVPTDCGEPLGKRRVGLYLRTSRDLTGERVWSSARTVAAPMPPETLIRVAQAKGLARWAVSYTCSRPANAPGGPVSDLCVQYTSDLSIGSLAALTWFSEPVSAGRSTSYLALRSGGDGSGQYGRVQHFWMTDRYGNLDTPAHYSGKAGFLTWTDPTAPRQDGAQASAVYGRPVYWGTWSVRNAVSNGARASGE